MAEEKYIDPVAQHADLFDELIETGATYIENAEKPAPAVPEPTEEPAPTPVPEAPVAEAEPAPEPEAKPEEEDTVTLNGRTYKKEHLEQITRQNVFGQPVTVTEIKPEFESLYKGSGFIYGSGQPGKSLTEDVLGHYNNMLQQMSAAGMGLIDFGVDAATSVANRVGINAEGINRQWDKLTHLDAPGAQKLREFASVALPSMMATGAIGTRLATTKLPFLAKFGIGAGSVAAADAAIISVSDEGTKPEGVIGNLGIWAPDLFGPNGKYPMPTYPEPNDPEAAAKTQAINRLDAIGMSFLGDAIGLSFMGGRKVLGWFKPKNATAEAYKAAEVVKHDPDTVIKIAEIDQALATNPSQADTRVLKQERAKLIKELEETGTSSVSTKEPLEQYLEVAEESRRSQIDEEAILKLEADPIIYGNYVPEITPGLASPAELARQTIPPANVARNMVDTAAIKMGVTEGDPAPLLSGPMLKQGNVLGQSRKAVQGLAEASRDAGDFDAMVGKFRMTNKQMNEGADQIYADIIRAGDADEVRRLFADNRMTVPLADGTVIDTLNPMQNRQVGIAIRDLIDVYLGRDVTRTSARVMDTLGREIATIADAQQQFRELADDDRIQEMVLDKLEFLMQEHGLNKYISGWLLQNQGWWNRLTKSDNPGELAELINEEFTEALNAKHAGVKRFVNEIRRLGKENPDMVKPLFEAFANSNGDVDTLVKYMKWASTQTSPLGMLISKDPRKMNMFARTLWGVGMNNVLSIVSAGNAIKGTAAKTILQPIEGILGHGIEALVERDVEPLKRAMYYYGAVWETQRRALKDAIVRSKKVHHDYDFLMEQIRSDYKIEKTRDWDMLDAAAAEWERTGNFGKLYQYKWLKANQAVAEMPWMRTAMTAMSGVDAYGDTIQANILSRTMAYDDVFTKAGKVDPDLWLEAEKKHYSTMFNADGVLTNKAAKNASGEVAMNLDDGVASFVNQAVTAVPAAKGFFMFPKTAANEIKQNLSYTPIAAIPGINKYGKIINAGDDPDLIREALLEHNIKMDSTPNAMAIYKRLQAEYKGRIALGGITTISMYNYAMGGNIRGNGPVNASERQKLRDNYGWQPKTINIGGKWVSFKGIPMLDPLLTLVGDMAYYQNDIGQAAVEDLSDKIAWTVSATFINNNPLAGVEPFLAALSGDENAWNRMTANMIRTFIPQSGNLGMVSNAITSAQKDIYGDMMGQVKNRLPGFSSTLPEQIDFWTGKPLNDIDNWFLRGLNAASPIKVSSGGEKWRQWLLSTGYDGISRLRFSSEGNYEYDAPTRERLGQLIGEQQLYKKIEKLMTKERFNDEIKELREFRKSNATFEEVRINNEKSDLYKELNRIVNDAKAKAEAKLFEERPEIREAIYGQQQADVLMGRGDVKGAVQAARTTEERVEEIRRLANP